MSKRVLLSLAAALVAAPLVLAGAAHAANLQGVFQNNYYTNAGDESIPLDNVHIANYSGGSLCALIYVNDADQEMRECCGCLVTEGGLAIADLNDLTDNPANGVPTSTGAISIISSSAKACDPAHPAPTPQLEAWTTHFAGSNSDDEQTETEFTAIPLSAAAESSLVAECAAIELIGSGKGVCRCDFHG